jgi:hypothetical protein
MRRGFLALALLGLVLAAEAGAASPAPHLFAVLTGARSHGALLVDEANGAVGPVRLGMKLGAAQEVLPDTFVAFSGHPTANADLSYCQLHTARECGGQQIELISQATLASGFSGSLPTGSPIAEIMVTATPPPPGATVAGLRTDGGVRLGSSLSRIRSSYRSLDYGVGCWPVIGPGSATYYATNGKNTLAFVTRRGYVVAIALLAGAGRRLCS